MTAATDTLESPPAAPRALVVCADPTLHRSGIGRQVAAAAAGLPGVQLRDLYQLYPDFYIDVRGERALLASAPLLVFAFRLSWYAMPALLKEWCDTVLAPAWAGAAPPRLGGKALLAAVACDSRAEDYRPGARHGRPLEDYLAPLAQTAHACGMRWLDPHPLYDAAGAGAASADGNARGLRALLARHAGIDLATLATGGTHGA